MKQPPQLAKILAIIGLASVAMTATVSQAANVFYAGSPEYNSTNIQLWRDPTVVKPMDIDGDNVYGTAGYVMFGTGFAGFSQEWTTLVLQTSGTLVNLPLGLDIQTGWLSPNLVIADGTWFPQIQDPATPANLIRCGQAGRYDTGSGQSYVMSFGANMPGAGNPYATLRVAYSIWNPQNQWWGGSGPTTLRMITPTSDTGGIPNATGAWGQVLMFYDIKNYNAGDVVEMWLNSTNTRGAYILGMTFDVATNYPTSLQPLSISTSGGSATVTWTNEPVGTTVLQSATNVTGPFTPVAPAPVSPYTVPATNQEIYFRTSWTNP